MVNPASHRDVHASTKAPPPSLEFLSTRSWSRPLQWFLPATTTSLASFVALVGTPIWLSWQYGGHFNLSGFTGTDMPRVFVLTSSIIVMALVWRTWQRPSPFVARFQLFLLVLLCGIAMSALAGAGLGAPPFFSQWREVGAVALFVSATVLLPRLLPGRPESWLLLRLAPMMFLFVYVAAAIIMWNISENMTRHRLAEAAEHRAREQATQARNLAEKRAQTQQVRDHIERMHRATEALKAYEEFPWTGTRWRGPHGLSQVETLERLVLTEDYASLIADEALWAQAEALESWKIQQLPTELRKAHENLWRAAGAVAASPQRPRLSSLSNPAMKQPSWKNDATRQYKRNPGLTAASRMILRDYQVRSKSLSGLRPTTDISSPSATGLREIYKKLSRAEKAEVLRQLHTLADSWPVAATYDRSFLGESPKIALEDALLALTITPEPTRTLTSLGHWFSLSLSEADGLAARDTGCHLRAYEEGRTRYKRLDCTQYRLVQGPDPSVQSAWADPHIELRIVWKNPTETARPSTVYFTVAVPREVDPSNYQTRFMKALCDQIPRQLDHKMPIVGWNGGRDGACSDGFRLRWRGRTVRVQPVEWRGGQGLVDPEGKLEDQAMLHLTINNPAP